VKDILLLRQLNRSYRQLRLQYSRLAIAFLLMILTALLEMSGLSVLYPLVLALSSDGTAFTHLFPRFLVSGTALDDARDPVIILLWGVALLFVAKNVTLYFTYRYNINFAMHYYRHLIRGLYSACVHKPLLEFREESSGALANMICTESVRLVDGVIRPLLVVATEALLLVAIAAVVCVISPGLIGAVIVACGGAGALYYARLRGKALEWGRRRMEAASTLHELVNNTAAGISEIKVFGKEDYLTSRVYEAAMVETDMFRNLEMYQQGPRFVVESVFMVTLVAVYSVAFLLRADTSVLLAEFSVIAASSFRLLPCLNRLVNSYSSVSFNTGPALALMKTINEFKLLSASPDLVEKRAPTTRFTAQHLQLEGISFTYPSGTTPVLKNLQATVRKGQRVGIVGASGSGKSTFIEMLAGLYDPSTGAVLVDGRTIADDAKSWRASIGYVPQTPFIMPGTIRENVAFEADRSVRDSDVWHALERVGLSGFVLTLPEKLETGIGDKGIGLSGGQKQLLCLARALFREPQILLLDEPTAALDRRSADIVLRAIKDLPPDTTIVMVSHQMENFADFDLLYVCEHGGLTLHEHSDGQLAVH